MVHTARRIHRSVGLTATPLTARMLLPFDGVIRPANGSRYEREPRRTFDQIYGFFFLNKGCIKNDKSA